MTMSSKRRFDRRRSMLGFKPAASVRATRAVLALSVSVLALACSGAAIAQTCDSSGTLTISCNGDFTSLPGGSFLPVADLTLILGDNAPTSVIPAAGTAGVDASWGGQVAVISHADIATVDADGIDEYGSASATLHNYGSITASGTAAAARALNIGAVDDVTVVNGGNMLAQSTGPFDVTTISAHSSDGNVSVANLATGTITALAQDGNAIAIAANADAGTIVIGNDGTIIASSINGPATAIRARASGDIGVSNTGTISAAISSNGGNYSRVTGIYAASASGTATIVNSGDIDALNNPANAYASAVGVNARGVDSAVTNSGSVEVGGATAYGVIAYASGTGGRGSITNTATGTISVSGKSVTAVIAGGYFSVGQVDNAGTIIAAAVYCGRYCYQNAVGARATTVNNSGSITVSSGDENSFFGGATGIRARSYRTDAVAVSNSGGISVDAAGFASFASGIYAFSGATSDIVNSGDIAVTANGGYGTARGIDADTLGDATIVNSGDINATAGSGAVGIHAFSGGVQQVSNSGSIMAVGSSAQGIAAYATTGTVDNSGSISVTAHTAFGIQGNSNYGDNTVTNSGDVTVSSDFEGHGVNTYVLRGSGVATFHNSGSISVSTNVAAGADYAPSVIGGAAYGVNIVNQSGDINASNTGSITSTLYSYSEFANGLGRYQSGSTGLLAYGHDGNIDILNSGSITASNEERSLYFGAQATAIKVTDDFGDVAVTNAGAVSATARADYLSQGSPTLATGIQVNDSRGTTTVDNGRTGAIAATSSTLLYGTAAAIGVDAYTIVGSIDVTNAGVIRASAQSGATSGLGSYGPTTATGIRVTGPFSTDVSATNSGTGVINATARTDHYGAAQAFGIDGSVYYGALIVTNSGAITVVADANNHADLGDAATATGIRLVNASPVIGTSATLTNSGAITASASAYLSATAQGATVSGLTVDLTSAGAIRAVAAADATFGTALATGVSASGGTVDVGLRTGSMINASASGHDGLAIGLSVSGDVVTASNAGTIDARFAGANGVSYGAIVLSNGGGSFTNTGAITSASADRAVGVKLGAGAGSTLVNSGMITAISTTSDGIAVLGDDAGDTIRNSGTLTGAIITGSGNDILNNGIGGVWNVVGASTDFGAGDDSIVNAGLIRLNNSRISVGSFAVLGNMVANSGRIEVAGTNRIDMGAGNPNPFINTGMVDFRNGAAADSLTLLGNWAGNGRIGVDVSGLHGKADILHIMGNVAAASGTAVDVTLLDLPTTAISSVPVIDVTGDSTATSFVLGQVHFDTARSFLVVQGVGLVSDIDSTNAKPDVFSVRVAVTGLTDTGTLAASIVPGVQSLLGSEIGTWRQRMGVIGKTARGHVSTWGRFFQDDGTVDAGHVASNFGQEGNFAFKQTNSGEEGGVDFAVSDELSVGVLAGKALARQNLGYGGAGSNRIEGFTFGAYGTWVSSSGFYLDASYRRLTFHSDLNSAAGLTHARGNADAFNLETGFDLALGNGFKLEPQIQYTHIRVGHVDTLSGALVGFTPQSATSSRGRAGVLISKTLTAGSTIWTPYASLSAVREFDGNSRYAINGVFFGQTDTKGTSALLESGLAVQTGKMTVTGSVNWRNGGALKSFAGGQIGLRYAW
jgi:outer membrane autotransporter protein